MTQPLETPPHQIEPLAELLARPARPLQSPTTMELTVELDELEAACVRELSSQTGLPPVDVLRLALDGLIRSVAAARKRASGVRRSR